jgi:hypothetical protein
MHDKIGEAMVTLLEMRLLAIYCESYEEIRPVDFVTDATFGESGDVLCTRSASQILHNSMYA